ncbi:13669_t:CDS:2, partial [Cetraspora pellucida]
METSLKLLAMNYFSIDLLYPNINKQQNLKVSDTVAQYMQHCHYLSGYSLHAKEVNNKPVRAHIYEYTTQISIKYSKDSVDKKTTVSTQILFCLKEKNKGKTGSHRWFFNAFCPILNPRICVLIDVGVRPAFTNNQVAGACGKLDVMNNKSWIGLLNPVVGALIFENKMANIINKPFESIFGYILYLPKNFSAYRYSALHDITNDIE